jgi:thioredoxin 1
MKNFFALIALCALSTTQITHAKFQEIKNMQEFEQLLKSKKPVILQFSASWCPACNNIKELVPKVAQEKDFNSGSKDFKDGITIARLDTDKFGEVAKKYGIQSIPAMVALDKNGKVLGSTVIGGISEQELRRQIRAPYKK